MPAILTSHTVELPTIHDGSAWNLRTRGSNAGSSVSSPPADDPDYDEFPHPHNLPHQYYEFIGTALKASPTSSNEADLDTDLDTEWDPATSGGHFPSPDGSFSDIGRFIWEENQSDEAIIIQHGDDAMNAQDHGEAP